MKNLQKVFDKLEKRVYVTEQAKKEIAEIMEKIKTNEQVTTKKPEQRFFVRWERWTQNAGWINEEGSGYLQMYKGKTIMVPEWNDLIEIDPKEITYINLKDFVTALEEYLNILVELPTREDELNKIKQINKILEEV